MEKAFDLYRFLCNTFDMAETREIMIFTEPFSPLWTHLGEDIKMEYTGETQLVVKAQNGDSTAFAELVRRYRTAAYAAAYLHLRDHNEAEDVTQDALLTAYEKIANLTQPSKFGAWLCAIAARKAKRSRTRKRKRLEGLQAIVEERKISSEYHIWEALEAGEMRRVVRGLVAELSQLHREAIELYYFQGYTVVEIAKFLDVPVGTVKRRLYDARERLKGVLSETIGQEFLEEFKRRLQ
jgi:RNA polymerase sigma factor (sigma-70 family)